MPGQLSSELEGMGIHEQGGGREKKGQLLRSLDSAHVQEQQEEIRVCGATSA